MNKKLFKVTASYVQRSYQIIEAESNDHAWDIAKDREDGWIPMDEHFDDGGFSVDSSNELVKYVIRWEIASVGQGHYLEDATEENFEIAKTQAQVISAKNQEETIVQIVNKSSNPEPLVVYRFLNGKVIESNYHLEFKAIENTKCLQGSVL